MLFSLLISLCSTIVAVPYNAVTPDLSEDYDERTSLTMFRYIILEILFFYLFFQKRFMFGLLGALIGTFCHALLIEAFANPKYETDPDASPYDYVKGYLLSATVFFVPIVSSPLVTFFGIREKPVKKYEAMGFKSLFVSYIRGLKYTFTNKPFVLLLIVYFLSWVVVNTIQSNLILWVSLIYFFFFFLLFTSNFANENLIVD